MLKQRIISGVCLSLAVLALALWANPPIIFIVLFILSLLASWELFGLCKAGGTPVMQKVGTFLVGLLMLSTYLFLKDYIALPCLFSVVAAAVSIIFISQLFALETDGAVSKLAHTMFGIAYISVYMGSMVLLTFSWGEGDARFLSLYLILVVKSTDIGAYFTGRKIGKTKLIPAISPAKTWEGCFGGLALAVAVGFLTLKIADFELHGIYFPIHHAIILPIILSVSGMIGDLIESLIKRSIGVKDSGSSIKGMGGLLDVLDSLMFAAPIGYIYIATFLEHPGY